MKVVVDNRTGMAPAALGFPFTAAQLKELERQAMIYKFMMASLPVPPHLLLPITPNSSHLDLPFCNNNNNKDGAEPGRCKRTDGKKWRCSRNVVGPQHKYCERHMHKSRTSRSRKPVELHQNHHPTTANAKTTRVLHHQTLSPHEVLGSTIQPPIPNRGLNWMLAMDRSKQQQWQQQLLQQTNITSVFNQDCIDESLNLIPYADECNLFLNPDLETPRGFIDAWSNEDPNSTNNNNNESSVSSRGNLSPSSLTLSMATAAAGGSDALTGEMGGQIQMGLGIRDSDHHEAQVSSWLSSVSWEGSTPGGPLAEVLRPSSAAVSTPATRVSSPSAATPEIMPFQWLS